jgi:hypothetical protein
VETVDSAQGPEFVNEILTGMVKERLMGWTVPRLCTSALLTARRRPIRWKSALGIGRFPTGALAKPAAAVFFHAAAQSRPAGFPGLSTGRRKPRR